MEIGMIDEKGEELIRKIHSGVYTLTFKKKDGTERTFKKVTAMSTFLPPIDPDIKKTIIKVNNETLKFFCVNEQYWRSCLIDNIITMEPTIQIGKMKNILNF